jgi:hypothetical protein
MSQVPVSYCNFFDDFFRDNEFAGYLAGRPDIRPIQKPDTGYPVQAGHRISGAGRTPDIRCRPDIRLDIPSGLNIQMPSKKLNNQIYDLLRVLFFRT